MEKKMKKGQFYIISALIIAAIVFGLTTVMNYSTVHPAPTQFYDLSKNFEAESTQVIDYGVYSNEKDIQGKVKNFTESFLSYAVEKDPNIELFYIYGNKTALTIVNYGKNESGITTKSGSNNTLSGGATLAVSQISYQVSEKTFSQDITERAAKFAKINMTVNNPGDWVKINIAGIVYDFNLKDQEQFEFIIKTTSNQETIINVPPKPT